MEQSYQEGESGHSRSRLGTKTVKYLFTYKYTTYVYDEQIESFTELKYDIKKSFKELKALQKGIREKDRDNLVT